MPCGHIVVCSKCSESTTSKRIIRMFDNYLPVILFCFFILKVNAHFIICKTNETSLVKPIKCALSQDESK